MENEKVSLAEEKAEENTEIIEEKTETVSATAEKKPAKGKDASKKNIYNALIIFCAVVLAFSLLAMAYIGVKKLGLGGITWTLSQSGVLTVSGEGDMEDFDPKNLGEWLDLNTDEVITKIVVKEGITSIGDYAFYNCNKVTEVSLPKSLKEIGKFSFQGCALIKKVTVPESVTQIGEGAFYGCSSLYDIDLPDTLNVVEYDAFYGTSYYKNSENWEGGALYISNCLVRVDADAVGSYTVREGTLYIADGAFSDCEQITGIEVADGVIAIGADAFVNCNKLYSVTLPTSLEYLGANAFGGCTRLTDVYYSGSLEQWLSIEFTDEYSSPLRYAGTMENDAFTGDVVIPEGVLTVGACAFGNCDGITSVTLSSTVTTVADNAFFGCDSLAYYAVPDSNVCYKAVDGVLFSADGTELVCYPLGADAAEYTIPDGVSCIRPRAFAYNDKLTSVLFNEGLAEIGDKAFLQCSALQSVVLPDTVISVGQEAFADCTSATELVLSDGLATVGSAAFGGMVGVKSLTLAGDLSSVDNSALKSFADVKSIVFDQSLVNFDATSLFYVSGLESLSVEEGNSQYSYEEGLLLNAERSVVVMYLPLEEQTVCRVPEGVTDIGMSAFEGADKLEEILLPESLKRIEKNAFCGCTSLTFINLPSGIEYVSEGAFEGCYGISDILDEFYASCIPLAEDNTGANTEESSEETGEVFETDTESRGAILSDDGKTLVSYIPGAEETVCTIPEGVEKIGEGAFIEWPHIEEIILPDSLREIAGGAFNGCGNVKKLTISGDFTDIENSVFRTLTGVTDVTLADGLVSFDMSALHGLENLENVTVEEGNAEVVCGGNGYFSPDKSALLFYMPDEGETEYTVPDGVTVIGDRALERCYAFTKIVLPEGLAEIGSNMFEGWDVLSEVVLPEGLLHIGDAAFADCYALAEIALPDSLVSIGASAFFNCTGLEEIVLPEGIELIGDEAFFYCNSLVNLELPDKFSAADRCRLYGNTYYVMKSEWGNGGLYIDGCLVSVDTVQDGRYTVKADTYTVADYAFMYCADLTEIVLPASVKSMGTEAFLRCDSLTTVYYEGSAEDWQNMTEGKWDSKKQNFEVVFID